MLIAVAGPYSAPGAAERARNLDAMQRAAAEVMRRGHVPVVGVTAALGIVDALAPADPYAAIMEISLALVARCDAIWLIGESPGANRERDLVAALGKPVYRSAAEIPAATAPVTPSWVTQDAWDVRFEWGVRGALAIGPGCDAIVVVDVHSFTTCTDLVVARGGTVLPYRWRDAAAARFAAERGTHLAAPVRSRTAWSLSPESLRDIPPGTRLVLPSPNGAAVTLAAAPLATVFAGCLRNASAVAHAAARCGMRIAVIACGERWDLDDTLRPALEDLVGAGAILAALPGTRSPEAELAVAAFAAARGDLAGALGACTSGRELRARGFAADVEIAAALDASPCAPRLVGEEFTAS